MVVDLLMIQTIDDQGPYWAMYGTTKAGRKFLKQFTPNDEGAVEVKDFATVVALIRQQGLNVKRVYTKL